jgi:hypothetical protein
MELDDAQRMYERTQNLARILFNAYNDQGPNPWKTFDGRDVPRWPEVNDQVRGKWMAAAAEAWLLLRAW